MPPKSPKLRPIFLKPEMKHIINSCVTLLEGELGEVYYPDAQQTDLCRIAREVGELLMHEGCTDRAAVVAATLGDMPYSVEFWRKKVTTNPIRFNIFFKLNSRF